VWCEHWPAAHQRRPAAGKEEEDGGWGWRLESRRGGIMARRGVGGAQTDIKSNGGEGGGNTRVKL